MGDAENKSSSSKNSVQENKVNIAAPAVGTLAISAARRTLAHAMIAIGRADDPQSVFHSHENEIFDALRILGNDHPLARALREKAKI